jgi:hypothetical protein
MDLPALMPLLDVHVIGDIGKKRLDHAERGPGKRHAVQEPLKRLRPGNVIVAFLFRNT